MKFKSYHWAIVAAAGVAILVLVVPLLLSRGSDSTVDRQSPHSAEDLASLQSTAAMDYSPQIEIYQELIKNNPNDALAFSGLGDLYLNTGKNSEAAEQFNKAIAINPNDSSYYLRLAVSYFGMGMVDVSLRELQRGLAVNPKDQAILATIGDVYANTGKPADAKQMWQKAIEADPNSKLAQLIQMSLKEQENPGSTDSTSTTPAP